MTMIFSASPDFESAVSDAAQCLGQTKSCLIRTALCRFIWEQLHHRTSQLNSLLKSISNTNRLAELQQEHPEGFESGDDPLAEMKNLKAECRVLKIEIAAWRKILSKLRNSSKEASQFPEDFDITSLDFEK